MLDIKPVHGFIFPLNKSSPTMDEGDSEGVDHEAEVGASRGDQIQGKETEIYTGVEDCNVIVSHEIILPPEEEYPRSSIQDFMDILDGKDTGTGDVHFGNTLPNHPCATSAEGAEGRVQELTVENYNALLSSGRDDKLETLHEMFCHVNQPGGRITVEGSHRSDTDKDNSQEASISGDSNRGESCAEKFPGQWAADYRSNALSGQGSSQEIAFSHKMFSPGNIRTKMISKSGFSEYFVKGTLKGKGVICKGQMLPAPTARFIAQNDIKVAVSTADPTESPLSMGAKLPCPSPDEPPESAKQCSSGCGDSLRDWIRSQRNKVSKYDILSLFSRCLNLVDSFHSTGKVLLDLRPSCFKILAEGEVKYCGKLYDQIESEKMVIRQDVSKLQMLKRPRENGPQPTSIERSKQQKLHETMDQFRKISQLPLGSCRQPTIVNVTDANVTTSVDSCHKLNGKSHLHVERNIYSSPSGSHLNPSPRNTVSVADHFEEKWYRSPEELCGRRCNSSSNIYALGVLLFEMLSCYDLEKTRISAMSDVCHRIFPPDFLSQNPKEAGICLWLLHPDPSLRPTTRDILQLEVSSGSEKPCTNETQLQSHGDETDMELLSHFLMLAKEYKEKHTSKLSEEILNIESDIKEAEKRRLLSNSKSQSIPQDIFSYRKELSHADENLDNLVSAGCDSRFLSNVNQLENVYFSTRNELPHGEDGFQTRSDTFVLKNQENSDPLPNEDVQEHLDGVGAFFDGLCKYARYKKFEVCGTLRNGDLTNTSNVICSLSFDRDEDYFAAAGVSKKVKIFEFQSLCDNAVDIHYPVAEMSNESKLSCISWNSYIRNYLASTDYDGTVKLWDVSTGQEVFQFTEHERRAWSVDFSKRDPMNLVSGSDDGSVKIWNINEKRNSSHTIRNVANVCCVQYSSHSSNLLAFGSADYKLYCYDLRNINIPWCVLTGHEKAVSHVKFLDSETLVSASTDNTLKLWDLKRSSPVGASTNACNLTLRGHTNEKNFVGLSVADGYITCGSETNEVFAYYKSLPMPITSHKFGSINPDTGRETDDGNGQFVSSVCCRAKSNAIVAANSSGCIKVLRMV